MTLHGVVSPEGGYLNGVQPEAVEVRDGSLSKPQTRNPQLESVTAAPDSGQGESLQRQPSSWRLSSHSHCQADLVCS